MNYERKRSRQSGRQECRPSDRWKRHLDRHYDWVHKEIQKNIDAGILPKINFENIPTGLPMKSMTKDEFMKMYPTNCQTPIY